MQEHLLNHICSTCSGNDPTQFCVCSQAIFCSNCSPMHLTSTSRLPHFMLPLSLFPLTTHQLETWRARARRKAQVEGDVEEIKRCKVVFVTQALEFKQRFEQYKARMEASFDLLQGSFATCVHSGVEDLETHGTVPIPIFDTEIARHIWSLEGEPGLLRCIKAPEALFEPLKEALNDAKVVVQTKVGGVMEDWESEDIVVLRGNLHDLCHKVSGFLSKARLPLFAGLVLTIAFILYQCAYLDTPAALYFPDPTSSTLLHQLGPYSLSTLTTALIALSRPVHVETGDYKGQWDPTSYLTGIPDESHINGYGMMAYRNGDIYEGHWKEGKRHGSGRLITAKGTVWEGLWTNDEFNGWGKCGLADGTSLSGQWKEWTLEGLGRVEEQKKEWLGEFKAGHLRRGLMWVSASEFAAGEWRDGGLGEVGLEYDHGSLRWGNYSSGAFHSYPLPTSTEFCISRFRNFSTSWQIEYNEVSAISFKANQPLCLTAIGLGNSSNKTAKAVIKSISLLQGQKTEGPLIYDHGRSEELPEDGNSTFSVVRLGSGVTLEKDVHYTLRVVYQQGLQVYYGKAALNYVAVENLRVRFENARFEGDDKEHYDHEWTSPLKDFYFTLA